MSVTWEWVIPPTCAVHVDNVSVTMWMTCPLHVNEWSLAYEVESRHTRQNVICCGLHSVNTTTWRHNKWHNVMCCVVSGVNTCTRDKVTGLSCWTWVCLVQQDNPVSLSLVHVFTPEQQHNTWRCVIQHVWTRPNVTYCVLSWGTCRTKTLLDSSGKYVWFLKENRRFLLLHNTAEFRDFLGTEQNCQRLTNKITHKHWTYQDTCTVLCVLELFWFSLFWENPDLIRKVWSNSRPGTIVAKTAKKSEAWSGCLHWQPGQSLYCLHFTISLPWLWPWKLTHKHYFSGVVLSKKTIVTVSRMREGMHT